MEATSPPVSLRPSGIGERLGEIPVLESRGNGPSRRLADRMRGRHPAIVFLTASVLGYLLVLAFSVVMGYLLTKLVLQSHGVASDDERFVHWLAVHRTSTRTDASLVGSIMAGGVVIPTIVGVVAFVLAGLKRWRVAAFLVAAIVIEAATYRLTIAFVHRDRPRVVRLEDLQVNASFPSGHTAASIAVYCGLALLLTSRFHATWVRVACWSVVLPLPVFVALSRMYRGMHHPLDSLCAVLIGIASLIVALWAARAADVAACNRDRATA
jgi:undecaprenyl-diphosphatase